MIPANPHSNSPPSIDDVAAQWVLRRDRGLTAAEQDALSQWLAADPRHGEALALHRWGWDELDRLTGLQTSLSAVADPDLLAPRARAATWSTRNAWRLAAVTFATAAVLAVIARLASVTPATPQPMPAISTALAAPCERRVLDDGSVVDLNRGAALAIDYSAEARRIRMHQGEANFTVAKNSERPFIVSVGGFEVRAVGTAFNVRMESTGVEVLVTEGRVSITRADEASAETALPLDAGQFAVVGAMAAPRVTQLAPAQAASRLAWQPRLLDFTDATLAEIVAAFNERNTVQLVVNDAALTSLKLSATFRSDNVEGFVQLMESAFGMRAEWRSDREIALRRAK